MSLATPHDDFERWIAASLRTIADGARAVDDVESIVDAMVAARTRHRTNRVIAIGGGVLAAATAAGIALAMILAPQPNVGPSPTPSAPSSSASLSASPEPTPSAVLPGGTNAIPIVGLPVYAEPGIPEPFTVLNGANVYVRGNERARDGTSWQEIQFASPEFSAWVFGWVPVTIDGQRTLTRRPAPECPTQTEFSDGLVVVEPPVLATCLELGAWSTSGYLVRVSPPESVPYAGEPAWLVRPPEYALVGAIGPALTSWELPLWFDPEGTTLIDPAWVNDRDGQPGLRVTVTGTVHHQASRDCHLIAASSGLADPTSREALDWCQQRFVVMRVAPGFAEPPATRPDIAFTTCRNPGGGYSVDMPEGWNTNPPGAIAPCSRFLGGAVPPATVAADGSASIVLTAFDGGFGWTDPLAWLAQERTRIAGFSASRGEVLGVDGLRTYMWIVNLGDPETDAGPTLVASTAEGWPGDYEQNKRVLDWLMRSLRLFEP